MRPVLLVCVVATACASSEPGSGGGGGGGDAASGADAAAAADAAASFADAAPVPDAGSCEPPDMMILLDRTLSMSRKPTGGAPPNTPQGRLESRWGIAVQAVEHLTAELHQTVRFGLALFPRDPGEGCITLKERLDGMKASNPGCQKSQVMVAPQLEAGALVDQAIDVETTRLCVTTPIGPGLERVAARLANVADPVRQQFVLLVTDGGDTCDVEASIVQTQALAAAGVRTFVVGFGAGGNAHGNLNNLACAGHTAAGFPGTCVADGQGAYRAADPDGEILYYLATEAADLLPALEAVAGDVCCGCVID